MHLIAFAISYKMRHWTSRYR